MKVCTTTIPFTGMNIEGILPLEALNSRLQGTSGSQEIVFQEPPKAILTLTRTHGGILVKGTVSGSCKQDCASCADPVPHSLTIPIDWILQTSSDRAGPDDELDDPGVIVYEGEHIDLEEHLQEALILGLSPFWHPPRDEQDKCTHCNRDCSVRAWGEKKQEKASPFGALLKGALSGQKPH
jgi:uncharacterized metal-binding protein YceD (DUF177 family)